MPLMADNSNIDDEKLLEDSRLYSRFSDLLTEDPEEHINFTALGRGLGLHDTAGGKGKSKRSQHSINFHHHETPAKEISQKSPTNFLSSLFWSLRRASAIGIDLVVISLLSVLFFWMAVVILVGQVAPEGLALIKPFDLWLLLSDQMLLFFGVTIGCCCNIL